MSDIAHPRSVITGISVLYTSLLLEFVGGMINIIHVAYGMPSLNITDLPPPYGPKAMLGIVVASMAIGWFLISRINARHNWARYTYLLLMIAGLVIWSTCFEMAVAQGIFAVISAVLNTLLGIVGLVCLFTPSANKWFKHGCKGDSCD